MKTGHASLRQKDKPPGIANMVFISVCTALYSYAPQGEDELALQEGEIVYILEKSSEGDWWKAKKRAPSEDEDEPVGLVPYNYVTEVSTAGWMSGDLVSIKAEPMPLNVSNDSCNEVLTAAE